MKHARNNVVTQSCDHIGDTVMVKSDHNKNHPDPIQPNCANYVTKNNQPKCFYLGSLELVLPEVF